MRDRKPKYGIAFNTKAKLAGQTFTKRIKRLVPISP